MATYIVSDGLSGSLTIICAATGPIVPSSCPTDGTNFMKQLYDFDSGVGTEFGLGINLRQIASGGSVEAGVLAHPLRVDPTGTTTQPVSGTVTASISGTVAISAASLPLPSGAATAAKQPALGTAGTASADVITVQGIASGTVLPISGTVTANAGTNLNTSALALETGGNLATLAGGVSASKYQVQVAAALPAGTNVIGHVIVDSGTITTVSTVTVVSAVTAITNAVTVVGAAASGASKSGNPVQVGGVFNTTQPTVTTGQVVEAQMTARGAQIVATGVEAFNVVLATGSNTAGNVALASSANFNLGVALYRNINLGATGQLIKGGAQGNLYGWYIYNNAASTRFVKFYNKATAPTVGTDTPFMTVPIPAGAGANVSFAQGIGFSTGLGIGATNLIADNDTTAPSANDVVVNILYF